MPNASSFTEVDVPNQSGKCFVVTGANTGIGYEIANVLAARGARVLLGCRDEYKANDAISRIRQDTPFADLSHLELDLADLASIRAAANQVSDEPRVDALINNAGVMTPPLMRTVQGFELQFGVNHLGCFALTSLLLPKLAETPRSRVVVTSSIAHKTASIDWDDLNATKGYDRFKRYAASKLANALFFLELDRRLRASCSPITALGCHPGMAATDLGRYMGSFQMLLPLVGLLLNSAAKGARPALQAATGAVKPGAFYGPTGFCGVRGASGEAATSRNARNIELAQRLWERSIDMTGIDPGLPSPSLAGS